MIHSILIIGQSNMAGRGKPEEAYPIDKSHIKVLRNGRWQGMYVPVNPDRAFSGVCLAETFAERYASEHGVDVGIIPCADGGTSLSQWQEGGLLYDNAVYQTRLAMRTSTVVAVLWHQGEADCAPHLAAIYYERALKIFEALRRDLGLHDVPFILGELGHYLPNRVESPNLANYKMVNDALWRIAENNRLYGCVSAEGLAPNADNLHFSSPALREFGIRYYEEFLKHEVRDRVFVEKASPNDAVRTEMEEL